MNKNTLKMSLRTLIVLLALTLVAQGVAAQDAAADRWIRDNEETSVHSVLVLR